MLPIPELRAKLEEAMDTAIASGVKIVPGYGYTGTWRLGILEKVDTVCALGAYDFIHHPPVHPYAPSWLRAGRELDMVLGGDAFVTGFDWKPGTKDPVRHFRYMRGEFPRIVQEYMLGRRLARKYR